MTGDPASGPDARSLRLFIAVPIPEHAKRAMAAAIEPWRQAFPRARWIPSENWHVTLKFLGRTDERLVPWVEERVRAVAATHEPAPVRVDGLGAFPGVGRARVLWAGVDDPTGTLSRIATELEGELAREFRPEIRGFTPHVTVARSEPPIGLPETYPATPLRSGPISADRLVVFRSHLRRPTPWYEPLVEAPLGG